MTTPLNTLAGLYSIADHYHDYRGEFRRFPDATLTAILNALGVAAEDPHAADLAIREREASVWTSLAPPVLVLHANDPQTIEISVPQQPDVRAIRWELTPENQQVETGSTDIAVLEKLASGDVESLRFDRYRLPLPACLGAGYHQLTMHLDSGLSATTTLIVAPEKCYLPEKLRGDRKVWGLSIQLYTLRSSGNWGIGDFRDLRELIEFTAPHGCAVIGLNPLHALLLSEPQSISPYSPASRHFLNALYIAIEEVPEFQEASQLRSRVASSAFQRQLKQLRAALQVQYAEVVRIKLDALRSLYEHFREHHLQLRTTRAREFDEFVQTGGEALQLHAVHCALDADFRSRGPQYWGWPTWPLEYRNCSTPAVHVYAKQHLSEVQFYQYLQWIAQEQLRDVQKVAIRHGMPIGLYGDIAVGANSAGSETWADRNLYLQGVSIGAPPDPLALKGQAWGVPPQSPAELRHQKYAPFITLLRNNMRYMGALRLDHVMALARLWWVPAGMDATQGAYVHYPLRDLIGILILESVRNRCIVVGEDLGTVPDEMRFAMERHRILHYKVLFFEKDDAGFKSPERYGRNALATVTTHDLPTLCGWWQGDDLRLRDSLNLYPNEQLKQQIDAERETDRVLMMQALVQAGLWNWRANDPLPEFSDALARAIQLYLAKSSAMLVTLQLEDLLGMSDAVNVPGTHTEHANWQRKLSSTTAEALTAASATELFGSMTRARSGLDPNSH